LLVRGSLAAAHAQKVYTSRASRGHGCQFLGMVTIIQDELSKDFGNLREIDVNALRVVRASVVKLAGSGRPGW